MRDREEIPDSSIVRLFPPRGDRPKDSMGDLAALSKKHDLEKIADLYKSEIVKESKVDKKEGKADPQFVRQKAFYLVTLALRYSTERQTRDLVTIIHNKCNDEALKKIINEESQKAFKAFERWGHQISRFKKEANWMLSQLYADGNTITLESDILYAEACAKQTDDALTLVRDEIKHFNEIKHAEEDIPHLMTVAHDYLKKAHADLARKRLNLKEAHLFEQEKVKGAETPCKQLYSWAEPRILRMGKIAESKDKLRNYLDRKRYELIYTLDGKDIVLSQVELPDKKSCGRFLHGQVKYRNVEKESPRPLILKRIEKHVNDLMTCKLDTNNHRSLKEFYSLLCETMWLMGNYTLTERGTGTTVQQFFSMAHSIHGLRTPMLKLENPHFDVNNISYFLDVYQKEFIQLFEKESLPRALLFGECKEHLSEYIKTRDKEGTALHIFQSKTKKTKTEAADKMIKLLDGERVKLSRDEYLALTEGRLGKIISDGLYREILPIDFKNAEREENKLRLQDAERQERILSKQFGRK